MARLLALLSAATLLALGLRFTLPIVDPYAAEVDPWHTHVVIGAASSAEVERALADHRHHAGRSSSNAAGLPAAEPPQERTGSPDARSQAQVYNLAYPQESHTSPVGSGMPAWLAPSVIFWGLFLAWLWQAASSPVLGCRVFKPLLLLPPPRFR